jgi:pre-mRNA-splicing factor CWC22
MATRGGMYIPPHRLRAMQAQVTDHSTEPYQRNCWEALRKSLNGVINKVNAGNMPYILPELFHENLVRGRGLFVRSLMRAQLSSPVYSPVYAALIAVVNTKLPEVGELLVKRVVLQFRRAYKRNQKVMAVALAKFIAHLVNQGVAHEILALQVLTLLLEAPTDDSVEVGVAFTKECGAALSTLAPAGLHAVFERFRSILQEGALDRRVQYTIEGLFAVRKAKFADCPAIPSDLDLVEEGDRITHEVGLDDEGLDGEELLDVFKLDPQWDESEAAWGEIRREILGDPEEEEEGGGEGGGGREEEEGGGMGGGGGSSGARGVTFEEDHEGALVVEGVVAGSGSGSGSGAPPPMPGTSFVSHLPSGGDGAGIIDMSETDLVNLRRTIYLTIMSSANYEECAHKLLKMAIPQ